MIRKNKFKAALKEGKILAGMACMSACPVFVEVLGYSGFDFVFIDTEHTTLGIDANLESIIKSADLSGLSSVVRVKGNDEHMIRNALEMGAEAIVVPHIRNKIDAENAVKAAKFPPRGIRGASAEVRASCYGCGDFNWEDYIKRSNEETMVIGLAEDKEFFDNIDEILSVNGLDMINFGPTDLAMSLGLPLLYKMDHPTISENFKKLTNKAKKYGVFLMSPIAPPNLKSAEKLVEAGVQALITRNDISNFRNLCQDYINNIFKPIKKI